ncbi:MAG TPA: ABC transporter substrate-binding protein [Nocardioides sp.]|nr:ABC transporter substrate-binding protein [uncultured Nocardioides sp.]HEX5988178.1 ABC transporter substrate-binding protein [Nocardioides sp.]
MNFRAKRVRRGVAIAATAGAALTLTGCLGGGSGGGGGGDEADGSVTIWTSMDQPVVEGLEKSLAPKAEEAGIDVKWERVTGIDKLIMTKLNASDKPDIAIVPQPGVVANMVKRDGALPLDDVVDMDTLQDSMLPGVIEAGTVDEGYYGLQVNANVKSIVFYPKKAWEEAGYPTEVASLDELSDLTEQIKSDGGTPWCLGIFSEGSVGWPATDWIEDLVARVGGEEFYNDWVAGEAPFTSPEVKEAATWFEDNVLAEGNVLGGRRGVASTDFGAAGNPMFDDEPGCWMMKQGTFITGFFPDDVQSNLDEEVGVFGFPPMESGGDNYVIGGGDLATMLRDDDDTKQIMQFLSETDTGAEAAKTGAYISPHADFDANSYPNEIIKTAYTTAVDASAFLFDGSDQMPGEVGAGTFWSEMTSWVSGDTDLDTALQNIDDSWPAS